MQNHYKSMPIYCLSFVLLLIGTLQVQASFDRSYEDDITQSLQTARISFSLDECFSTRLSGAANDYSEFTAEIENSDFVTLNAPNGLYRRNPNVNGHSCAPGVGGTRAMCVDSDNSCAYRENSDQAIRFDIAVNPMPGRVATLSEFSFYQVAPEMFSYLNGPSGENDFPTKFGIRILPNIDKNYKGFLDNIEDKNLLKFLNSMLPSSTTFLERRKSRRSSRRNSRRPTSTKSFWVTPTRPNTTDSLKISSWKHCAIARSRSTFRTSPSCRKRPRSTPKTTILARYVVDSLPLIRWRSLRCGRS